MEGHQSRGNHSAFLLQRSVHDPVPAIIAALFFHYGGGEIGWKVFGQRFCYSVRLATITNRQVI
jgi:hypothetical protein